MRVKYRGEPDPDSAWSEIIPCLFMGGHIRKGPAGERTPVVVGAEFDVVISLYRRSKWALNNQLFVEYLTTGLDVAGLLADLDG